MKVRCDYCRQMIDDGLDKCPNCGATINKNRTADAQPKTIEELKDWYTAHNLPPEEGTRFFIGKDYKEPKAFGIYKSDDGDFVVYKNKADGERAIRYQGSDEQYAVNELYQRLKAEIADQKSHNQHQAPTPSSDNNKAFGCCSWPFIGICIAAFVVLCILVAIFDKSPSDGYYSYNGNDYYRQGSSWYSYNEDTDDWSIVDDDDELNSNIDNDNEDKYHLDDFDGSSFEDSNWYDSGSSDDSSDWDSDSFWDSDDTWDSDYDSGSSWDSDSSWDSGSDYDSGSSWDSDW